MTLNLNDLTPSDYTPKPSELPVVATVDAVYHDQHGDSSRWAEFEWDAYHRAIAKALAEFRDA
jgi:hypothetical protein